MRISIAMATCDGERFVGEQLASLAGQSRLPDELVVCDDRSGDSTAELVERFAAEAPFPVRVQRNGRRLGFADNFLRAASLCEGDAVAFCDQDDVWLPDKLRVCAAALDAETTVVAHSSELVDEELRPLARRWPALAGRFEANADVGDPWLELPGFVMLFRRLLLDVPTSPRPSSRVAAVPMAHDEWVYFLGRTLGTVRFLPDALVLHRVHRANTAGVASAAAADILEGAVATGSDGYREQARLAREYAAFLERLVRVRPDHATPIRRSARAHSESADRWERRADLYSARRFPARVRTIAGLAVHGGYGRRRAGGLGGRSLAKDVAVAAFGVRTSLRLAAAVARLLPRS